MNDKMMMTTNKPETPHYMWMYFHTKLQDTVLFSGWNVTDIGTLLGTCAILIFMGMIVEAVKYLRAKIQKSQKSSGLMNERYIERLLSWSHALQTLLFIVQLTLSYMLMLVFMTFSIWLGLAVCVGLALGFMAFGMRSISVSRTSL